jgi:hypothetical protein
MPIKTNLQIKNFIAMSIEHFHKDAKVNTMPLICNSFWLFTGTSFGLYYMAYAYDIFIMTKALLFSFSETSLEIIKNF